MRVEYSELRRLTRVLIARGIALVAFGALAIAWPETLLIPALILVGLSSTVLGLYELSLGISLRGKESHWVLILLHGIASITFGLLTGGVTALPWPLSVAIVTEWLLAYAWLCFTAAAVSGSRTLFKGLLAGGIVNVAIAAANLIARPESPLLLLCFGALYAAAFGAWQLAMGLMISKQIDRVSLLGAHRLAASLRSRSLSS